MVCKIVFLLLPLVINASKCENGCGTSRIMGGDMTEAHSRPFQVAIYSRVGTTGELGFCGGSLVHPQWVLTAAHCCYHGDSLVDNVQAILGAHSLYDRYENGRRIINVEQIEVHADWQASSFSNDLALMKLANAVQLTETINTIRLPYLSTASFNFAGAAATASGWGIPAKGVNFVSPTLQQKVMTVMTDPLCESIYNNALPQNVMCGFSTIEAGTCKGDNGGPLTIWNNVTEETILIGVASFVGIDGCSHQPSVFTRVQHYMTWIRDVTGIVLD